MSDAPSLYELLEVDETAGDQEITLAFRRVAKRWHPDVNSTVDATERMQHISAAYAVLRDPERRADYDHGLHPGPQGCTEPENVGDAGSAGCESAAWASAPSAPSSIDDAGPPPGFRTPPHAFSLHRARGPRSEKGHHRSGASPIAGDSPGSQLAAVICVLVCPGAPFLLAAARGGGTFVRWGCAYALATLLWGLAVVTGAGFLVDAAVASTLLATMHSACWRERLGAAIRDRRTKASG